MNQVLYRKWRPKTFSEVTGQEHITSVLRYEAANGKTAHAYLFCGSRGTGKTTCAKILAKVVNCENPRNGEPCGECESCIGIDEGRIPDVVEMDAASNTGVDYIRDIRDTVIYAPSNVKYRVYIIDEVHMLSQSAFNAFLKTLEEPPEQVIFILATTEIQKLPATIISRCRRFDFRRITLKNLTERLSYIAEREKLALRPDGALVIARLAQGGMRDAISMLELCAMGGDIIDAARVRAVAGIAGRETSAKLAEAIAEEKLDVIFREVNELYASSKDIAAFWQELVSFFRDMLILKTLRSDAARYLDLTDEEYAETEASAACFTNEELLRISAILDDAYVQMQRNIVSKRLTAEFALIKAAYRYDSSPDALAARISALEDRISRGYSEHKSPPSEPTHTPAAPASQQTVKPATAEVERPTAVKPTSEQPTAAEAALPSPKTTKTPRAVPWWIEVTAKLDPMLAPMLRDSRAVMAEGETKLTVEAANPMALSFIDKPDTKQALLDFARRYADVTEIEIKSVEKRAEKPASLDDFDEQE